VAQPVAFSLVAVLLTVGLLAVARQSQDLLESSEDGTIDLTEREEIGHPDRPASRGDTETTPPIETAALAGEIPAEPAELTPAKRSAPARNHPREIELTSAMVIANVAVTQGLMAGIILASGWYFGISAEAFGVTAAELSTGLPAVGIGVGFGALLWIGNELVTTVADAVGAAYDEGIRELLAPDSPRGWLVLFGGVLPIIAVSEELLFRAALIGVPAASFAVSPWLLAVVSSLAFAFGHGAQGRVGVVVTGLLGFVLAVGYILTGSLLIVIVAHYVVNALEFLVHEYLGINVFARPR